MTRTENITRNVTGSQLNESASTIKNQFEQRKSTLKLDDTTNKLAQVSSIGSTAKKIDKNMSTNSDEATPIFQKDKAKE